VRAIKKSAKEIAAYHEAGHAVVAYLLHRLVRGVTIIPDRDMQGCCYLAKGKSIHPDYDRSHKTRLELERHAMISWGGNVAECLFTGKKPVADSDMHSVVNYLSYLTSGDEEIGAYADWLWYRTKSLLQFERHWAAVDALATELVKNGRVGQKRTREIIHRGNNK